MKHLRPQQTMYLFACVLGLSLWSGSDRYCQHPLVGEPFGRSVLLTCWILSLSLSSELIWVLAVSGFINNSAVIQAENIVWQKIPSMAGKELKGRFTQKFKFPLFTQPYVVLNLYDLLSSVEHNIFQ